MPLFHHFNINDNLIILISGLSCITSRVTRALARNEYSFFLFSVIFSIFWGVLDANFAIRRAFFLFLFLFGFIHLITFDKKYVPGLRKLSWPQPWPVSSSSSFPPPSEPRWRGASPPVSWGRSSLCWPAWSPWFPSWRASSTPPCTTQPRSWASPGRPASTLSQQDSQFWVRSGGGVGWEVLLLELAL